MAAKRICSIPDCGKRYYGGGLCNMHWQRVRKHGDPYGGGTTPGEPLRYLNEIVLLYEGDECLSWPFGKITAGYGTIHFDGRLCLVSRVVCERVHGPPPTPEHEAAHSCGKGHEGCVAKRHLSWKTSAENKADQLIHGTRPRGSKHGNAKLSNSDVIKIRSLRGKAKQADIAHWFGVDKSVISRVQSGKRWAWLD